MLIDVLETEKDVCMSVLCSSIYCLYFHICYFKQASLT